MCTVIKRGNHTNLLFVLLSQEVTTQTYYNSYKSVNIIMNILKKIGDVAILRDPLVTFCQYLWYPLPR